MIPFPSHHFQSSTEPPLPPSLCPPLHPSSSSSRLGVPKRAAELSAALDARVALCGGDRPVHSVLVANNGLAATKFMRSIRSWAYKQFGSERAGGRGRGSGWLGWVGVGACVGGGVGGRVWVGVGWWGGGGGGGRGRSYLACGTVVPRSSADGCSTGACVCVGGGSKLVGFRLWLLWQAPPLGHPPPSSRFPAPCLPGVQSTS